MFSTEATAYNTVEAADYLYEQSEQAQQDYDEQYDRFLAEFEATHDEDGNPLSDDD